jgi:DNA-binding LytR/AlgR family response regulator
MSPENAKMEQAGRHFKASKSTLYFNTRDELVKVKLEYVAYFEADSNYCHVVFINGAKATLLTSLINIENLISQYYRPTSPEFIRIGKRYIVNLKYIFQINIPRQKLILTDYISANVLELSISKEALKTLKDLYINS